MRAVLNAVRAHVMWAALFSALANLLFLAPTLYMLQVYDRVVPTRGATTLGFLTIVVLMAFATFRCWNMFVRASWCGQASRWTGGLRAR